jgi:PAS domain S-box-containing protein
VPLLASGIVCFFTAVNLCGVKWVMRLAMPIATISALLAFLSATIPVFSGSVDWRQAFTFHLMAPFQGWFGQVTSVMAGLYLIGFAAPAFEQAACHVGETINPNKNIPRAMFASAALASLYFIALPLVWLGTLGPDSMAKELALEIGPTFAPLLGGAAKAAAIWFMIFNMLHGTLAPLAGAVRTLAQLSEDGLLPEFLAKRSRATDAPWAATVLTAAMAIAFLLIGDPVWLIAAANLTYLIGIALPSVAVWLLRRNEPQMTRPYRAPRGTILLGLLAAGVWALTAILGFQQFGLPTVLIGITFAYAGAVLYAWRKFSDRRKMGLPGVARTLHLKLTGAMLLVLVLDAVGYLIAVRHVPPHHEALIVLLEDTFVVVALLTFAVGLILPGMIAHSAVEVSKAAEKLVKGTLADFTRAMRALAAGDLEAAKAHFDLVPVVVHSRDEVGDMALNFNKLQEEIGRAAIGLEGAREGLSQARGALTETNERLRLELADRKQAEETLRRLRDQHALILNSIDEGVHGIDCAGLIIFENPGAAKMLGYEVSELLGRSAHGTIHHTRADGTAHLQEECSIYATLKDGAVRHVQEDVFWRKDGTSLPVAYTSTPVRDENGQIIGATIVFTDITERKKAEELRRRVHEELERRVVERTGELSAANANLQMEIAQRHQAQQEAERANRAKSEFLSRMSHELRTPLNAILGFGQLLEMDPLDAQQTHSVRHILKGGRHLLTLINEVLDIARIEAGKLDLELEPVPVRKLLDEVLAMMRPLADQRGIRLDQAASANGDRGRAAPHVLANAQRLRQVLINLISNAIKYNREGGWVEVRCAGVSGAAEAGRLLRIAVSDSGQGIPAERMGELFAPFERLGTEHSGVEGSGLGLALSKRLIEAQNGSIEVESRPGIGSTFAVLLPLAAAPEPLMRRDDLLSSSMASGADPASGSDSDEPPMRRTVLYIEDNLSNLNLVECLLKQEHGVELLAATEGGLGLKMALQYRPDLILLDVHLPDLPGEEVLRRLRADHVTRDIPVVMISADAIPAQIDALLAAGAQDYITKPLNVKCFLQMLCDRLHLSGEVKAAMHLPAEAGRLA